MARDKLTEYSATASENTVCGDVNIAENSALPSDLNNYAREIMTHLKEFADGTNGINVLSLADDDASAAIKIQAPSAVTATVTFTLPDGDGADGQALITNGSGTLAWAYPYGNRNLVINGAMQLATRGMSFATMGSGDSQYTLDRFKWQVGGSTTAEMTVTQSSTSPNEFSKSLKVDVTTADTTLGAGDIIYIQYKNEGNVLGGIAKGTPDAKPLTLSFYVRSNLTGTFVVYLFDVDNTRTVSGTYTINAANTWERKEVNFPADNSGALTIDNSHAMSINWVLGAGSNLKSSTLQTSWGSYDSTALATGSTDITGSTSNEWYITGVQLEVGEQATPFEHEPFGVTLQKAQRYYISVKNQSTYAPVGVGRAYSGTNGNCAYYFPCEMRTNPTVSVADLSKFDIVPGGGNPTSVGNDGGNLQSVKVGWVSSGVTNGGFYQFEFGNNTDGELRFDAEL